MGIYSDLFIETGVPIPHRLQAPYQVLADIQFGGEAFLPSTGKQLNFETAYAVVTRFRRSSGRRFSCKTVERDGRPMIRVMRMANPESYPATAYEPYDVGPNGELTLELVSRLQPKESILVTRRYEVMPSMDPSYIQVASSFRQSREEWARGTGREFQMRYMDYGLRIWRTR